MIKQTKYPELWLGTAMWDWTVEKESCHALLDEFYESGFRYLDCATNYPIDKDPTHFRWAEKCVAEWIASRGVEDLKITMKIGSIDNSGSPDNELSPSFLSINKSHYQDLLGSNLHCLMIHWDNRKESEQIRQSIETLKEFQKEGLEIGFSGLKFADIYQKEWGDASYTPYLQFKFNLFQSQWEHYKHWATKSKMVAYGLSAGGVKLSSTYNQNSSLSHRNAVNLYDEKVKRIKNILETFSFSQSPAIKSMHQLGMLNAIYSGHFSGILIGPSKSSQLKDAIYFHKLLQTPSSEYLELIEEIKVNSNE